mgnify:CR=1 FL=1
MKIDILTLFPEMFVSPFNHSIIKRAQDKGLLEISLINIRDFAPGKHKQVDDYPYGGGAGMVMKADIVIPALESCKSQDSWVIFLSPQGRPLNQLRVTELGQKEHLILLCGHYEGIDHRVLNLVDEEISIGDYVLTGGELPAMVLVDAVSRMIPGVLGAEESSADESFANGLLEYPQYTRPRIFRGEEVPEVLLSGHHENIKLWRKKQSLLNTLLKRPELLINREYDPEEKKLLQEILFNRE